jgi:hypothetical protein
MRTTRRGGTGRGALVLSEEQPRSRGRRILTRAVLVLFAVGLVVAGYVGVQGFLHNLGGPRCQATAMGNSVDFDPSQTGYAATLTGLAVQRGLPPRAATIAIATAIQESKLRNLRYGDRDSLGLFQQRPSQGWGTEQQILDPVYSTNAFYDALVKVKGYDQMEITKVAQEVQKSAYPAAYADHEQEGRILASALSGHSPAGLGCRLDPAESGDPEGLAAAMRTELGVRGTPQGRTITVKAGSDLQAWTVGSWAVAKAGAHGVTRVRVGDRQWTRTRDEDGWSWQKVSGSGAARTVTITFAAPPAA